MTERDMEILDAVSHALKSYMTGNVSTDLAAEIVAEYDRAVGEVVKLEQRFAAIDVAARAVITFYQAFEVMITPGQPSAEEIRSHFLQMRRQLSSSVSELHKAVLDGR